jgi:fatty acid amide hydrolase 2
MKWSFNIWATKMSTAGNVSFCEHMGDAAGAVNPWQELLNWLTFRARHTLPAIGLGIIEKYHDDEKTVRRFRAMCDQLRSQLQEILGDDGVLIYPAHPVPAPYHNQPLSLILNFAYTAIFNVLGFPVTAVPMGLSYEGVPIGLQVVANLHNDHLTIAVAEELEKKFGGWVKPF